MKEKYKDNLVDIEFYGCNNPNKNQHKYYIPVNFLEFIDDVFNDRIDNVKNNTLVRHTGLNSYPVVQIYPPPNFKFS